MTHKTEKLSLPIAIIIGMNAMIGASIFTIPEQLHRTVGPAALLSYLFVIIAIWCVAYSLARIAYYYNREGSFYTYVEAWAGKTGGLIAASFYVIGLTVAMGLLTRLTGIYLQHFFPAIPSSVLSIVTLTGLAVLILAGTELAKWGQIVLLILTLVPLVIITCLGFLKADIKALTPFMPSGFNTVLAATKTVIFGFFGFEAVTSLYSLVENPRKNVPRAITWAIILVSLIYVTFVFSTIVGLPRELFIAGKSLPEVLTTLFPQQTWLINLIVAGMIITLMGTIHAMVWSVSKLLQTLANRWNSSLHLSNSQAVLLLSTLVGITSVTFKSLDLFFNIAALFILTALMSALVPLLIKKVPATTHERLIALIGFITSVTMCVYALMGIISTITGGN